MGGAGFPTAVKLSPKPGTRIKTLIINGTECEPYITADDIIMRERAEFWMTKAEYDENGIDRTLAKCR